MLVKFTIDPVAILPNTDTNASNIRNLYNSWWKDYGILVFPFSLLLDPNDLKCDQAVKDLLQRSYQNFNDGSGYPLCENIEPDRIDWNNILEARKLANYDTLFELALIEETRAEFLSSREPPPPTTQDCGQIEATLFSDFSVSKKFKTAKKLTRKRIKQGEQIDVLWQKRFQSLAKISTQVIIVDRYAAWNFYNNGSQALNNLFRFLEQDSEECNVTIYSASGPVFNPETNRREHIDPVEVAEQLRNVISAPQLENIKRITLFLSLDHYFANNNAHDRYIRFDKLTCGIGIGVKVFRDDMTSESTQFIYMPDKADWEGSIAIERDLENKQKFKISFQTDNDPVLVTITENDHSWQLPPP